MFAGITRRVVLLFAALGCGAALPATASPAAIHRIVAVGDLHGDFAAWRAIALAAGLIDAQGHWAGGATVFVQTGDVVDRGPNSLDIIRDLMRLQREAPRRHGRVVALVGNHETMNVTDDLRYVSAGDYAAFVTADSARLRDQLYATNQAAIVAAYRKRDPTMSAEAIHATWIGATPLGLIEHQTAWHPGGRIGRWVVANPAVALIDGNLFVHGGIARAYDALPIAEINRRVAAALAARDTAPDAIINAADGPLWYRGLLGIDADGKPTGGAPEAELDAVLKAYGATRMVIGHTPILSGIAILDGGRLVRIDTGISEAFGGTLTYLEIVDGALVPHVVTRPPSSRTTGGS